MTLIINTLYREHKAGRRGAWHGWSEVSSFHITDVENYPDMEVVATCDTQQEASREFWDSWHLYRQEMTDMTGPPEMSHIGIPSWVLDESTSRVLGNLLTPFEMAEREKRRFEEDADIPF